MSDVSPCNLRIAGTRRLSQKELLALAPAVLRATSLPSPAPAAGTIGEAMPYPEERDSRNLRRNRRTLLERFAISGPTGSGSGVLIPASN